MRKAKHAADDRRLRIKTALAQAFVGRFVAAPAGKRTAQLVDLIDAKTERLGDITHRAFHAIADDGGGERGALAAVLGIDILNDFLAPLVLEVDVDVGRFVALTRNKPLEQQVRACGIDFRDP